MSRLFSNLILDTLNDFGGMNYTDGKLREFPSSVDYFSHKINMAGIKKENIKVSLEDRLLKISAEQDGEKYRTSVYVPKKAEPSKTELRYEDGMLYIDFKKSDQHEPVELKIS
jgi:HSP20 family molecular chaperone IbpA|tara:strand:- start:16550 stop:16888 length:339 start_codon:yes stop_codon:yes gene_type:complete